MNIQQVEELTGVTKQNIRFYEKQGLLSPKRNGTNAYRDYGEAEIHDIKVIKLLRKLDMPIAEIKKVLERTIPFGEALQTQKEKLEMQRNDTDAAIRSCKIIENESIDSLNVDKGLAYIAKEEEQGGKFAIIIEDFKKIVEHQKKNFSFMPDSMIKDAREFTDELCKYADENNLDMIITKESMYPEFELNGETYQAARNFCRFGAVVQCRILEEEGTSQKGNVDKRYEILQWIYRIFPVLILFFLCFYAMGRAGVTTIGIQLLFAIAETSMIVASWRLIIHVK